MHFRLIRLKHDHVNIFLTTPTFILELNSTQLQYLISGHGHVKWVWLQGVGVVLKSHQTTAWALHCITCLVNFLLRAGKGLFLASEDTLVMLSTFQNRYTRD